MPIPLKWVAGLTLSGSDFNNVRLYGPSKYIIFLENGLYYAYAQDISGTDSSGSAYATIKNTVTGSLTGIVFDLILNTIEGYDSGILKNSRDMLEKNPLSYIIFVDSGIYYAKNNFTGIVSFSGSTASTVINSATAALPTKGSIIFVGTGSILVTNTIGLSGSITLKNNNETLIYASTDIPIFQIQGNYNILDGLLLSSSVASPTKELVKLCGGNYNTIKGCTFQSAYYGILISGSLSVGGYNQYATISNNYFISNSGSGLYLDGVTNGISFANIVNNYFQEGGSIAHIYSSKGVECNINGNYITDSNGYGILISGSLTQSLHIGGNNIIDNGIGGIRILNSKYNQISDNYLMNNNVIGVADEIYVSGSYNMVTSNYIYHYKDEATYCINIETGSYNSAYTNVLCKFYAAADYWRNSGSSTQSGSNPMFMWNA